MRKRLRHVHLRATILPRFGLGPRRRRRLIDARTLRGYEGAATAEGTHRFAFETQLAVASTATTDGVYRVGLIADTNVPTALVRLPEPLRAGLSEVNCIIHTGDLVSLDVLDEQDAMAPTTAVAGNCDPLEVARCLPERTTLSLAGRRVGVCHGHQRSMLQNQYTACRYDEPQFDLFCQAMEVQLPDCDVIVFGHFHTPVVREWHGILFVNPGSIAPPHARPTYAVLELGERVTARVHLLG